MLKKTLLSITLLSVVLVVSGLVVVAVIAGPGDPAQRAKGLTQDIPGGYGKPPHFDPGKVSYEVSQPDYDWIDVSAISDEQIADVDLADNVGSAEIEIGFYFPFFEGIYRQVRVSDNGYLYFGGGEEDGGYAPQAVPSDVDLIHNLIAPLGTDLFRYPGHSAVYIARQTDPERRLVLQFERAYWCCSLEASNDFQVILYPDGRILTQYQSIQSVPHAYLTVGIENQDGTHGHNFYTGFLAETNVLQDQLAMRYDPGDTVFGRVLFIPDAETFQGAPGQTVTLNTDLLNLSGADSSFTINHTLQVNGVEVLTDSGESEEPAWSLNILAEPDFVSNTDFAPLTVQVIIPETAVVGDVAVLTFQALPEAVEGPVLSPVEGPAATATFTLVVVE